MIEIDPDSGEPIRKLTEPPDNRHAEELLDESHLSHFTYTRSSNPHIRTEKTTVGNHRISRISIVKPVFIRRTLNGVITLLIINRFDQVTPGQLDALSILTNSAASAIANFRLYQDLQNSYLEAISALAHAIEARDECTKGHTDRVVKLARLVAQELGWGDKEMDDLVMGCTLHDIGKLGVPDSILNKPGELDERESASMRNHPDVGLKIVSDIELFKPAIPYIIAHHERYDGTGYPRGLKGDEIPIEGRLLAVLDTLDAILSDRPYRHGAPLEQALRELWENRGTQFDPKIVDVLFRLIREGKIDFKALYEREEDLGCVDRIVTTEKVSV
jgi:HD-GYP domain-containing protein (c-di-GMP phosphodiesterase class II)